MRRAAQLVANQFASTSGRGASAGFSAAAASGAESVAVKTGKGAAKGAGKGGEVLDVLRKKLEKGPDLDDFILGRDLLPTDDKYAVDAPSWKEKKRKPDWMKRVIPGE
jgi:hypothetical protein